MQRSPAWREQEQLLVSVPDVGPVLATTLLADVLELGCLNRKETLRLEETLGTSGRHAAAPSSSERLADGHSCRVVAPGQYACLVVVKCHGPDQIVQECLAGGIDSVASFKPHPNSLDTILTNPKMVTKEDGDGQQTSETDATRQ
jgi:hypothetical protein